MLFKYAVTAAIKQLWNKSVFYITLELYKNVVWKRPLEAIQTSLLHETEITSIRPELSGYYTDSTQETLSMFRLNKHIFSQRKSPSDRQQ